MMYVYHLSAAAREHIEGYIPLWQTVVQGKE